MKLNVYEKKKIVKTYEVDTYDLMFGVLEDVADAIKLDELKTGTDAEIIKMAGNLVLNSMETVKDLFKDIFDTLYKVLFGMLLASVVGITLGIILGWYKRLERICSLVVSVLLMLTSFLLKSISFQVSAVASPCLNPK